MNYVTDNILPSLVDTFTRSNVIFQVLMERRVPWIGKNKIINFKYKQINNGGWFRGFDKLNTNTTDTTAQLQFNPTFFTQPIVFANTDLAVSDNKFAVLDYMRVRTVEVQQEMADKLGNSMYGANTLTSDKIMLGLKDLIDDGTNVANYGGQVRSSYLETNVYRIGTPTQIWGNLDSAGGALTLARLEAMWRAVTSWVYRPNLIITTKNLKYRIQTLSPTTNQFVTVPATGSPDRPLFDTSMGRGLVAQAGFTDVYFKGIPVIEDEKCPEGELYMLNTDTFELALFTTLPDSTPIMMASAPIEGQYDKNFNLKDTGFHRSPTLMPYDQYGAITHLFFAGQMYCIQPKYNGFFTWLTAS